MATEYNRQYVGARYVPQFFNNPDGSWDWAQGFQYEPLTMVKYGENTYTSKMLVPSTVGSPNLNPDYWANTGNYNGILTELEKNVNKLILKQPIFLEDFGGKGDGITDNTEAFNSAINYITDYDIQYIQLKTGTYLIGNINLPKEISIIGVSSKKSALKSSTQSIIAIKGGGHNSFKGSIISLELDNVLLQFGSTVDDYGNQYIIRDCFLHANTQSNLITLINNCWNMKFENVICRSFNYAFFLNFTSAINSGAALSFTDCTITDGGIGIQITGATADGADLLISNTNIEHVNYSIFLNDTANAIVNVTNMHSEGNIHGIFNANGGAIFVANSFLFMPQNSDDFIAKANGGIIVLNSCRLNANTGHYFNGNVYINDNILPTNILYNSGNYTPGLQEVGHLLEKVIVWNENLFTSSNSGKLIMDGMVYVPGGGTSPNNIEVSIPEASISLVIPLSSEIKNTGGRLAFELVYITSGFCMLSYSMEGGSGILYGYGPVSSVYNVRLNDANTSKAGRISVQLIKGVNNI